MNNDRQHGFSLVEMAIVIIIIGLIAAAVMSVNNLVKTAELRTVVSDIEKYKTVIRAYDLQYSALPGDMKDATEYWPDNHFFFGYSTDNGNGNRMIEAYEGEDLLAWQHLVAGEFIPGEYTGELADGLNIKPGVNVPESGVGQGGYWLAYVDDFYGKSGNAIRFGSMDVSHTLRGSVINTPDAIIIDKKTDDGIAATGNVRATNGYGDEGCVFTSYSPHRYNKANKEVKCYVVFFID